MYGLSHRLDVLILPREDPEKSDLGRESIPTQKLLLGLSFKTRTVTSVRPASAAQIPWGG
ncbi:rCG63696 [Rattus norvegicus]|uniref:RCG63696 n=1 Tax=Rattus norvegicus TaxID=10116 RepID=A6HT18_RAT|nr:rCG63696 [Rattus norvegicus]